MLIVDGSEVKFSESADGRLCMDDGQGNLHQGVHCVSLFPLSDPQGYVSVFRRDDTKDKSEDDDGQSVGRDGSVEVAIVRGVGTMVAEQRALVLSDIRQHYFLPEITDILRINNFHSVEEWQVETDRGARRFYLGGRKKDSIGVDEAGMVLITDLDKCRYRVRDISQLSTKARILLERTLP